MNAIKSRILAVVSAVTLITIVACADAPTSPTPRGVRAAKDSTGIQGDTTLCRSGWLIDNGKVVCNASL